MLPLVSESNTVLMTIFRPGKVTETEKKRKRIEKNKFYGYTAVFVKNE